MLDLIKDLSTLYVVNQLETRFGPRLAGVTVAVDILPDGVCNLSCPSCPIGNSSFEKARRMDLDTFRKMLDRIQSEMKIRRMWLSTYSEPLLHPECWKFVAELSSRRIISQLSSNLNRMPHIEQVLEAGLGGLRISVSGFTEKYYSVYHKGGNIQRVKDNMVRLRTILDETEAKTDVSVGYHIYRDNTDEIQPMREFVESLGFGFHPYHAFYRPAEKMIAFCESGESPDRALIERLTPAVIDGFFTRSKSHITCRSHTKQLTIHPDGRVGLCCHSNLTVPGVNIFTTPMREIRNAQRNHPFCAKCIKHNGHITYNG